MLIEQFQDYVHSALVGLDEGTDPRAPGAAVTVSLCGSVDHPPPCRWPHFNDIDVDTAPSRIRVIFTAPARDEVEIRRRIEAALRGDDRWRVLASEVETPSEADVRHCRKMRGEAPGP